ncbi:Uncharacterized protein SAMN05216359_10377 [Roseateles sp. YR242]|nr:Uncharacterized protein SAMN05216359_10377 [Roseateles sp. YR242]
MLGALACASALLTACGGGSSGSNTDPDGVVITFATLVRVSAEAAGTQCANGGVRVQSGMDIDSNGVLADSEVSSTQYVCNGADGSNGSTGSNGLSTLVRVRTEASGAHCAQGGSAVLAGMDTNGNGVLEDSEVSSTSYVCTGSNGATGPTGSTGASGSAGYDSLVSLSTESAGANCAYGGQRLQSGLDSNRNGVLDITEVLATSFICSAAPADTQWVNVTGTAVQAVSNTGYLANASANVVITLPASPTIGDWVKVTGVGTGGWTIAQNAGQRITTRGLPGGMDITWTAEALTGNWAAVAMSADGTRQVAATSGDLYVSTDTGGTWVQRLAGQPWSGVASSSDGMKLVAVTNGGAIYHSADGGQTWSDDGTARAWSAVASSADGQHLVAVAYLGAIWTSADGGASWSSHESNRAWRAVSSSSDGRVLVAGTNGAQLYVSTDYGATWTARASGQYWWGLASSADGQRLYASVDTGTIWMSNDYGTTWEAQGTSRAWRGITTSSDGRFVVATTSGGTVYQSTDSGTTWQSSADGGAWTAVASSSDGLTLLASKSGGALYGGSRRSSTTTGVTGSVSGGQEDALQLQYVGGGVFMPISYVSASLMFTVR